MDWKRPMGGAGTCGAVHPWSGTRSCEPAIAKASHKSEAKVDLKQFQRGALILAAVAATGALTGAACGGGGGDDATVVPTKPASTAPAGATTAATAAGAASSNLGAKFTGSIPAGAPAIDQKDQLFKPDKITAKVGDTVYFSNGEAAIHSVNVDGKNILGQGGTMKQGELSTWKPTKAGTYTITCDYHPAMKATVTVQ
jgi:plastocyanin